MSTTKEIVEPCPFCKQRLRYPTHLFVPLIVTCPKCKNKWDWQRSLPLTTHKPSDETTHALSDEDVPSAIRFVPVREFKNTSEFFGELSKEIKSGQPVSVETVYQEESEFPDELKRFIKTESRGGLRIAGWNLRQNSHLVIALTTTSGALIGLGTTALLGGTIASAGAVTGAMLGLVTGSVSTILKSGSHKIEIVFDIEGKIIIRFNPINSESEPEA